MTTAGTDRATRDRGELPWHVEDVNEKQSAGISQSPDHCSQHAGLHACVEQHGESVGGDKGAEAPQHVKKRTVESATAGRCDIPAEDEGHGPDGDTGRSHDHEHVGAAREGRGEVLAEQVEHGGDHGETRHEGEDR